MSQRRETTRRFDPFIPGVACLVLAVMVQVLDILGIEVPERM